MGPTGSTSLLDNIVRKLVSPHGYHVASGAADHTVFESECEDLRREVYDNGFSLGIISSALRVFFNFAYYRTMFGAAELGMDVAARLKKAELWLHGLVVGGFRAASAEAAGLGGIA